MIPYKFIDDLTSDVMFEAYGKDLNELFSNAATAMFEVICDIDNVKPEKSMVIKVEGKDASDLLYRFLSELIAAVDTDEMFFSKFEIKEIDNNHLIAECYGEPVSQEKGNTVVKAVLYYGFSLKKTDKGFMARVACDI